ncbi:hypothetical protein F7725_017943 [Dissostichus mawsoni]|uniref:Zyxin n=1 Tax=Dissostichus mawsoni TaxID=36200 RepID=A0A7J5XQ21_DISMA|nr:hypothetical protein F7725_017943 [Dissostichus mawsoni]
MREVEELERMTKDFIRDMDTNAPVITSPPTELCGKCGEALSRTQPAVRAMEKLFHSDCFCCLSCQRPLQGLQFYDRDGAPQCDDCYTSSLAVCSRCGERITDRVLKAVGQRFSPQCVSCNEPIVPPRAARRRSEWWLWTRTSTSSVTVCTCAGVCVCVCVCVFVCGAVCLHADPE